MGMKFRTRWGAAVATGALALAGCGQFGTAAQHGSPPATQGLGAEARLFLEAWKAAGDDQAQRAELMEARRWPHPGPREERLREVAVAEAVRRGEVLFMGARTVVFENQEITAAVRGAALAVRPDAALVRGSGQDWEEDGTAVRVRVGHVERYAGGDVAVVPVELRRGRPWEYSVRVLCVFRSNRWEAHPDPWGDPPTR